MITVKEVAKLLQKHLKMSTEEILYYMEKGCKNIDFNKEVLNFALKCKKMKIKTAL